MLSRRDLLRKTATIAKGAALIGLADVVAGCSDPKPIQRKEGSFELSDLKVSWYEYIDNRNPANSIVYHSSLDGNLTGVEVRKERGSVLYYKARDETDALNSNSGGFNFRGEYIPSRTDRFAVSRYDKFWEKYEAGFSEVLDAYGRQ